MLLASSPLRPTITRSSSTRRTERLRIIQINDIYRLDFLHHLKTLITQQSQLDDDDNTRTLVICAGDFLSPSLLTSLDEGRSMVLPECGRCHICVLRKSRSRCRGPSTGGTDTTIKIPVAEYHCTETGRATHATKMDREEYDDFVSKCPVYEIVQVGTKQVAL